MIGKIPYQQKKEKNNNAPFLGVGSWIANGAAGLSAALGEETINELKKVYGSVDGIIDAVKKGQWGSIGGEAQNNLQLFNDLVHGGLNDDMATSVVNKMQEAAGVRTSGYITLNNHPFHVEPGSFTIKPKLNIAQNDMYMDGEDGKSYTYMQWLNTTGVVINLTIYNDVNESYMGWTTGESAEGETKTDTSLYDSSTKVNEVLLWWADTFTTVQFWTSLGVPNLKGKYKITDIEQTVESHNVIKTELELSSYTQDEMEDTYYKQYDIDDLVETDTSKDTSLAKQIKTIPNGLHKECNCTGSNKTK